MPCDSKPFTAKQSLAERKAQVAGIIARVTVLLAKRQIQLVVDPLTGAVTFKGLPNVLRQGVSDACIYRRLMALGNKVIQTEFARAEQAAGRKVDSLAVAQGVHSHDDGATWHKGH